MLSRHIVLAAGGIDVTEVRVRNWHELNEAFYEQAWRPELGRYRSPFAFRGLADADFPLTPALKRLTGDYVELERHLLRNFRKYALRHVVERDSFWNWLTVAQHYGLPTRMLDWTFSPFVALHFTLANVEKYHLDGVVWAVNYMQLHTLLPEPLKRVLSAEGSDVFTVEMLGSTIASLGEMDRLTEGKFALFLEPPSMDDRIVNQAALFSVASDPELAMDDWLKGHPEMWRKIVIPASLKWEFRDKLDQMGVTERVLFPGLEGLSRWLRRHYSPRVSNGEPGRE